MIARTTIGAILAAVAIVEIAWPGYSVYQAGWFNVAIIALMILLIWRVQGRAIVPVLGVAVVAFATVASGLLGPDDQTIVAAPGQTVPLGGAGTLAFPLDTNSAPIGARTYRGGFALTPVPRTVVRVEASDARGARLTITQPTGETFLSPVLLMRATQSIGAMTVPYDSFAVPALHRQIKAILFDPQQSAGMPSLSPGWNALFDVQDDSERQIPGGIGVVLDGESKTIGGVQLHVNVLQYPGVKVVSVPDVRATAAGLALSLGGLILPLFLTKRPAL